MKYRTLAVNGFLQMKVSEIEREQLLRLKMDLEPCELEKFDSDETMYSLLKNMVVHRSSTRNTQVPFTWANPVETGDLTSAPIISLRNPPLYLNVYARWAFMAYEVTNVQIELCGNGIALWQGGHILENCAVEIVEREVQLDFSRWPFLFDRYPKLFPIKLGVNDHD